jgi:hypothetical protein
MRATGQGGVAGLLALALVGGARGQAVDRPPPPPVFPRLAEAVARPHRPAPVPPGLEIEVLDPNVDPRGNPAVLARPAVVLTGNGPDGRVVVDIPPTVLVHRYYYTGDRTFQAGLLPGGPCVVVVSHPKTGERLYVPVQLPPGAPRVTYTADSIEYDYRTQAVTISFCCLLCKGPKVTYRQGVPITQKVEKVAVGARDATRRLVNRTCIPDCADKVAAGTKSVVVTTVDRANDLGKLLLAPPVALIRATPLANLFTESPEDRAAHERDAQVRRARDQALRQEDAFINTNR